MRCPRCSQDNKLDAKFCLFCGSVLPSSETSILPADATTNIVEMIQDRPEPLHPGQTMRGKYDYEVTRELGHGGMGTVYLAEQTLLGQTRPVVIKEMREYYDASDSQAIAKAQQRFETEARTLINLNFGGIPQIFDFFSHEGSNYIVMQYVEGQDLQSGLTRIDEQGQVIPGRSCSEELVLQWGIQACKILEYLALKNVVHLDIKPANLILDRVAQNLWLVDFGTAKAVQAALPGGKLGDNQSSVYGTIGYAPQEQYTGNAVPKSDTYALSATLYHLLTDDDPRAHPFQFPKLDQVRSDIAQVLKLGLEPDVKKRCTAKELGEALSKIAAPVVKGIPFVFSSGETASSAEKLSRLADKYWDEAREYLDQGDFERWFRTNNRHDLVAKLQQSASMRDSDQRLEDMLYEISPRLKRPKLHIGSRMVRFGRLRAGITSKRVVTLHNRRRGYMLVRLASKTPWLQVDPDQVKLWAGKAASKATVTVHADHARCPPKLSNRGIIDVEVMGRKQQIRVRAVKLPRLLAWLVDHWILAVIVLGILAVMIGGGLATNLFVKIKTTPTATRRAVVIVRTPTRTKAPTRTPTRSPSRTMTPTLGPPTATPTPLVETTPLAAVTAFALIDTDTLNVRVQPSTQSDKVGALSRGMCLPVLEWNEDSSWVQIEFAEGQAGWVSFEYVRIASNSTCSDISTSRPSTGQGLRTRVDRLEPGACTMLDWDEPDAKQVFLDQQPVDKKGSREVCPEHTQMYTLLVTGQDDRQYTWPVLLRVSPRVEAVFANKIELVSYSYKPIQVPPSGTFEVTLYWYCLEGMNTQYTVFTHLLDANGQQRGGMDRPPKNGQYLTDQWQPGELVVDVYTIQVAGDAPHGEYQIRIGLYETFHSEQHADVRLASGRQSDHILLPGPLVGN